MHLHTCAHLALRVTFNSPSILTASPRTLQIFRCLAAQRKEIWGWVYFVLSIQENTSKMMYFLSLVIS